MTRHLTVLGAASSVGAYGPGQEQAPAALRRYGLIDALREAGPVSDAGDIVAVVFREDPVHPEAANSADVAQVARTVADHVARALASSDAVLVLGGDCTVELGTVAGARRTGERVGLVYIDLDTDLTTPECGEGKLDWMGVAHLLGVPGTVAEVNGVGDRVPLLQPDEVFFVAADRSTPEEQATIDRLGLRRAALADCLADPETVVARVADWADDFDRVVVHVDVDVLDRRLFPIAENTREVDGLDVDTLEALVTGLCRLPAWAALTLCEVNPDHARDPEGQFARLVGLLARATAPLGPRGASRRHPMRPVG